MIATESTKYSKHTKLHAWGFFYKNDQEDGIGIFVKNANGPTGKLPTQAMHFAHDNIKDMVSELSVKNFWIKNQCIKELQMASPIIRKFYDIKKPTKKDVDLWFHSLYKAFISWLMLLEMGYVVEDEYNGFSFIYID